MDRLLPLPRGGRLTLEGVGTAQQIAADVLHARQAEVVVQTTIEERHVGAAIADQRTAEVFARLGGLVRPTG